MRVLLIRIMRGYARVARVHGCVARVHGCVARVHHAGMMQPSNTVLQIGYMEIVGIVR
jgi:hypothetical protein